MFQTGGILTYVEDLELGSNKEFGPKNLFKMTCTGFWPKRSVAEPTASDLPLRTSFPITK